MKKSLTMLICGLTVFAGCAEEPRSRTVTEFLDNPIVLEAALVRCGQNRAETRYEAECVNARQAISILEAKDERARQAEFESESNKKREALRRTQQAAAEARRRAEEAARIREEAEYLAQFGELPPGANDRANDAEAATNAPGMIIPEAANNDDVRADPGSASAGSEPASDGGNAPTARPASDLDAVRDELRKRAADSVN
ncbi:MAG: EexN family lipoprotein [Gammaproteobacteria bacterium]|nr:EexN family lipoprotein [Gammaproteobacteria bacterium]